MAPATVAELAQDSASDRYGSQRPYRYEPEIPSRQASLSAAACGGGQHGLIHVPSKFSFAEPIAENVEPRHGVFRSREHAAVVGRILIHVEAIYVDEFANDGLAA
jgi:hypothetical protein